MTKEKCYKVFRYGEQAYTSTEKLTIPFKAKSINSMNENVEYMGTFETCIINGNLPWLFGVYLV